MQEANALSFRFSSAVKLDKGALTGREVAKELPY